MLIKTRLIRFASVIASCALCAVSSGAAGLPITLAPLFRDGAVLQRGKPVPVWGTAGAGETITVSFGRQTATATAGADGKWRADLPAFEASAVSRALTVTSAGAKDAITVNDVVVGEVWLAAGQSNMERVTRATDYGKFETTFARAPLVRHWKNGKKVSDAPYARAMGKWEAVTPETVGESTGVGHYFALDLHRALGVPVGVINCSWGGTRVEAWMPPGTTDAKNGPAFAGIHTRWAETLQAYPEAKKRADANLTAWEKERAAAAAAGKPFTKRRPGTAWGPGHQATPGGLFNGMIAPHVPCALRGFIWYQGCSNTNRAHEYHALFSAMITGWRAQFAQSDLPFYWVQLANYRGSGAGNTEYADLRGAQTATLSLPNTGQAVTIDIGNVNDIHPRNKHDVGRRLALLALKRTYGFKTLVDTGPEFASAIAEGPAMRVTFKPSDSPLTSPRGLTPSGFELAGADKKFHPAEAKIEKGTVLVTSPAVPRPAAVRYAWRNAPAAGLFNQDGLPACPFRSDDW
ncbi:sialate O-acetylesterase [Termitidicoccus mucosus]|uniref:Sialate O-acetylesterase n=1 Tax=Termitidicoccus mucosus TaxID=1184151 RepID=A0A178IDX3_9BACT|nr:sialate O-acetylesterase [Opitutaceae bacterium TSB47]